MNIKLGNKIKELRKAKNISQEILAETYHETGQQALVEPTLEEIPEIYFTKLELMGQLLEGEKAYKAAKAQLHINLDSSVEMIDIMVKYLQEKGKDEESKKYECISKEMKDIYTKFK